MNQLIFHYSILHSCFDGGERKVMWKKTRGVKKAEGMNEESIHSGECTRTSWLDTSA